MSEETIEEISPIDQIVMAITRADSTVLVFLVMFLVIALLLAFDKISAQDFLTLVSVDGLSTSVLKLAKKKD
ncbi:hypothetical protein DRO29_06870 [Candidatus Bathyarchaeota archaeon]|nr:MAG: hypothetical protein DRO29_06870 [Candidatus Bathyarchaeota archaeon]